MLAAKPWYSCWLSGAGWPFHHYSPEHPCTEQDSAVMAGGQGTCSPFFHALLSLIISTVGASRDVQFIGYHRRILPKITWGLLLSSQSRGSSRKPLGGTSGPFLLPLRLLCLLFLWRSVWWPQLSLHARLPGHAQQLRFWLHSSINGNKLIV